ncbi:MAG: filamentous hemagglutinin N-terminal domain-containing protein, partial [Spirulina sp.]
MGDRFPFFLSTAITLGCLLSCADALTGISQKTGYAQSIRPASDEINTIVEQNNNIYQIEGGRRSGNNLFHSLDEFDLNAGEIADFSSHSDIQNILTRIIGGNPSLINGLIQVTGGNSNLYLMNPAGIVFGANASLNVSGDFFATTATGMGLEDGIFSAFGKNDYESLTGKPLTFEFDAARPAPIINAGNLKVDAGQNLALVGGNVINTGILNAPGGNITIAAVPGTSRVKISQAGTILTLEPDVPTSATGTPLPFRVLDLPALLTGAEKTIRHEQLSTIHEQLSAIADNRPLNPMTALVTGKIATRNEAVGGYGGQIAILGDRVALLDAEIDASGHSGGGNMWLGGEYQGRGDLPRATQTR